MTVLIAALSICLNALLPAGVMAMAAKDGQAVVICTSDGYKTIDLDDDGARLPAHLGHDGSGCAVCYS